MNAIAIVKDGRHDFDFFYGQWAVQHRLLKRRGAHCEDWLEFFGTAQCRGLMGGLCNVEENDMPARRIRNSESPSIIEMRSPSSNGFRSAGTVGPCHVGTARRSAMQKSSPAAWTMPVPSTTA